LIVEHPLETPISAEGSPPIPADERLCVERVFDDRRMLCRYAPFAFIGGPRRGFFGGDRRFQQRSPTFASP